MISYKDNNILKYAWIENMVNGHDVGGVDSHGESGETRNKGFK